MEKGSLSVIAYLIALPPKGRGQTDDPPIGGGCSVFSPSDPSPVEDSRRTQLIVDHHRGDNSQHFGSNGGHHVIGQELVSSLMV